MRKKETYRPIIHSFLKVLFIFMMVLGIVSCTHDNSSNPTTDSTIPSDWITLSFSGYNWRVKASSVPVGPGPNYFSDSSENVWVDESGQLHLRITKRDENWYCPEVVSEDSFGYGTYRFSVTGNVDQLNEHVVLGLFTWDDDSAYNHREIDIEMSRWGETSNENAQFVVQPYSYSGNMYRFDLHLDGSEIVYSFEWKQESIFFQVAYDYVSSLSDNELVLESWQYTGQDIPPSGNENARINVWLFGGNPPSDGQEVEVVVTKFEFIP